MTRQAISPRLATNTFFIGWSGEPGLDRVAHRAGDGDGAGGVGMDADAIGPHRDVRPLHRPDLALADRPQGPLGRGRRIHRLVLARDDQPSALVIVEVDIVFGEEGDAPLAVDLLM